MMLSFTVRLVERCFQICGSCVCFINVFVKNHLSINAVDVFDSRFDFFADVASFLFRIQDIIF